MNIQYLQSNLSNITEDNLIKFLFDIVFQDIRNVTNYQQGTVYSKGDRVYLQENNKHQIFQCIVENSSSSFIKDEWIYVMEVYEGPIDTTNNLVVKEEVHIITSETVNSVNTKLDFKPLQSSFALYCGKQRYAINHDFTVNGDKITFLKPFNIGDRIIFEVREFIGTQISIGVILYDLDGNPYSVSFSNTGNVFISKIDEKNNNDTKYTELVTGDRTYTLLVDGGSEPYELKAYRRIETYVTGTHDQLYKVEIVNDNLLMTEVFRGDCYADTKVILGLDKKFYTIEVVNNKVVASPYNDVNLNPDNFSIGLRIMTDKLEHKLLSINNGVISILPYTDNSGYRYINLIDKTTKNITRVSLNSFDDLQVEEGLASDGHSGTEILDYFYFFDDNYNYKRMYVNNSEIFFESCSLESVPDLRGINFIKDDGQIVKLSMNANGEQSTTKCVNLDNMGTFESPIEGFVVKVNGNEKLITVNKDCSGFELVDTDIPFRTKHHYVLSTDEKLYKIGVDINNNIQITEGVLDSFNQSFIFMNYADAGNGVYYYIDDNNGEVILHVVDSVPSNAKVGILVTEYEGETYKLVEDNGVSVFVKTDEVLSNASRYILSEDGQNYYYFTFDESFVCCNEELYDESVLNGGSLYNYIEYIDAGNNVYYYMNDDFIMVKAESIPNGAKVGVLITESDGVRYRLVDNGGYPIFTKTEENYINFSEYVAYNNAEKLYHFTVNDESFYYEEILNETIDIDDSYVIERANVGAFIKSNEMIIRFDIVNGECVFKPISTFVHRIKSDDGSNYVIDVTGEQYKETLSFTNMNNIDFETDVAAGVLYLQDENGSYYTAKLNAQKQLQLTKGEKMDKVDYNITSLMKTEKGWYKLILDNGVIKAEKVYDNLYENLLSYGNIVKKTLDVKSNSGTDLELAANGLGEIRIKSIDEVNVTGLLLRSDNGFVYGLGMIGNRFATYRSHVTNAHTAEKLFIKDTINENTYAIFMSGDRLCCEVSNTKTDVTSLTLYDVYNNPFTLEIINDMLSISSI